MRYVGWQVHLMLDWHRRTPVALDMKNKLEAPSVSGAVRDVGSNGPSHGCLFAFLHISRWLPADLSTSGRPYEA